MHFGNKKNFICRSHLHATQYFLFTLHFHIINNILELPIMVIFTYNILYTISKANS